MTEKVEWQGLWIAQHVAPGCSHGPYGAPAALRSGQTNGNAFIRIPAEPVSCL